MVNFGVYLNQEIKLHYTSSHKFTTLCICFGRLQIAPTRNDNYLQMIKYQ